jgi:hypothetical protein
LEGLKQIQELEFGTLLGYFKEVDCFQLLRSQSIAFIFLIPLNVPVS